jgi:iron complex transport system substrate-binding protein
MPSPRPRRLLPRPLALASSVAVLGLVLTGCSASSEPAEVDGHTVDTVVGEVTVPQEVDSVVVLEGRRDLDIVLSLGLPLVGYPYEGPDSGLDLDAPLAALTAEATENGARELFLADEINLEAIAEVAPSLIVSRVDDVEPIIDELRAIAPVLPVTSHDEGVTWQEDLMLVAEATGTEDKADELIAAYDARVDEIKATYAEQIASTTVVSLGYDLETTEVQATRLQNVVLTDLGALPAKALTAAEESGAEGVEYSPEQTFEAFKDAGAVLVVADTTEEWAAAQDDALYQQLPAVLAGNVIRSDKMTHEGGPTTAMHVLDLIEQLYATV